MNCKDIDFGTYNCAYNVMLPYKTKFPWEEEKDLQFRYVAIDKCLLPEIVKLWELGIKTTGCCCGHGRQEPFINVRKDYINKMKELGYEVQFNPCRPDDEDTFYPKTKFEYGEINKGFNWWEENKKGIN